MIVCDAPQGSSEWFAARAGCITGSMFVEARKRLKSGPCKGDFTTAAKDYAFRTAIERISGDPLDDGFETYAMRRGRELEEDARICHEAEIGCFVDLAGFVMTDDRKFGCSADCLIGEDGGGEYKCFIAPDKLRSIIIDGDWSGIEDQVQGGMWLTGRKWWDMCLYCPALANAGKAFTRKRVHRDDEYIAALEADLVEFEKLVSLNEAELRKPQQQQEAA